MTDAIGAATKYVHVEFYIMAFDSTTAPFFDALERRSSGGSRFGCCSTTGVAALSRYRRRSAAEGDRGAVAADAAGAAAEGRYQRPDLRNHRKLLVIDGRWRSWVAEPDRLQLQQEENIKRGLQWQDLMCASRARRRGINAVFVTDWYSETDELLLRETDTVAARDRTRSDLGLPGRPERPGLRRREQPAAVPALLYAAQERIIITSPYFVPDESMLYAITTAAQRGLDVRAVRLRGGDQAMVYHAQRSYYEALLRAGVRIWLYPTPYILHAKHLTIDDEVAVIGSSNMDMRSFGLNMEISLLVRGESFVMQCAASRRRTAPPAANSIWRSGCSARSAPRSSTTSPA